MFVTSDVYDLRRRAAKIGFKWQETLLCGVGMHGTTWRGNATGAGFMIECARQHNLLEDIKWASYHKPSEKRSRDITPGSFERLKQGKLTGAREADALQLAGERPALGTRLGEVRFGGEMSARARTVRTMTGPMSVHGYPFRAFDADFVVPATARPVHDACELLRAAVRVLGAEYGYGFLRDDLCFPMAYCWGMSSGHDFTETASQDADEIAGWRDFVREGQLWTGKWPLLRDLFEVNLISERHTSVPIEGLGYLTDWIGSGRGRGRLEDVGEGRWLWILTDQELFDTRPLLYEAGLLFSYQKRVYRDLARMTEARPARRLEHKPTPR